MKYVILAAVICGFASACTVRTERTVVERPVAQPAPAAVIVADPPPAAVIVRD